MWLVVPPVVLEHPMRDTDSLRVNGDLLILLNLLADFAPPPDAGDALSAQIARIVGKVVRWPCYSRSGGSERASCLPCVIPWRTP